MYTCCSCTLCTAGPVPADLIDDNGAFQLVLGVDDTIQQPHWRQRLRMPRRLLALLAVQCLLLRDEGTSHMPACIHCCGNWWSAGIGMLHSTDVLKFCTGLTALYGGHGPRIVLTCSHLLYWLVLDLYASIKQQRKCRRSDTRIIRVTVVATWVPVLAVCSRQCRLALAVCIHAGAANRSIDCAGRAVSDASQATTNTEQVKQLLQEMPHNCDYSINDRTQPNAVFV
jgi:hypothetical protein